MRSPGVDESKFFFFSKASRPHDLESRAWRAGPATPTLLYADTFPTKANRLIVPLPTDATGSLTHLPDPRSSLPIFRSIFFPPRTLSKYSNLTTIPCYTPPPAPACSVKKRTRNQDESQTDPVRRSIRFRDKTWDHFPDQHHLKGIVEQSFLGLEGRLALLQSGAFKLHATEVLFGNGG